MRHVLDETPTFSRVRVTKTGSINTAETKFHWADVVTWTSPEPVVVADRGDAGISASNLPQRPGVVASGYAATGSDARWPRPDR